MRIYLPCYFFLALLLPSITFMIHRMTDTYSQSSFIHFLQQTLPEPDHVDPSLSYEQLPGRSAQWAMATSFRRIEPSPEQVQSTRKSAVLLLLHSSLLHDSSTIPSLLLTLRRGDLKHHGGQISFPGGRIEAHETITQAALREAFEEIHLYPKSVQILGALTPLYVPVSNNFIFPVVGVLTNHQSFRPDHTEVEEIFSVALTDLLDPTRLLRQTQTIQGSTIDIPYWDIHSTVPLWGATAMITNELLVLLQNWQQQTANDTNRGQ